MKASETEIALIGNLLIDSSLFKSVVGHVHAQDFTTQATTSVFSTMLAMWRNNEPVDGVTVGRATNMSFCSNCINNAGVVGPSFARSHADAIAGAAKEKRVKQGFSEIMDLSTSATEKIGLLFGMLQGEIEDFGKKHDIKSIGDRFNNFVKSGEGKGFSTGWNLFDEKYIRYCQGHVWMVGGWTSTGKTATMIQMVVNLLPSKCRMVIISTEMTEEQLFARILSNLTGVFSARILSHTYRPGEEERVLKAEAYLKESNLQIYDDVYKISEIEEIFRIESARGGVDWAAIDYVQNIQGEGGKEYEKSAGVAKRLQALAKKVRANFVCLSQVSNDIGRGNADTLEYKGAGEFSAVADVGVMLRRGKESKYSLLFEVKKNRHGPLINTAMEFKGEYTRIELIGEISANKS